MINHIATNLITKGLLNISNITKGMIEIKYEIFFRKKGGGAQKAPSLHYDEESLYDEIKRHDEEDIDYIKVYVDWKGSPRKGTKKIKAELLKSFIEADILEKTSKKVSVQIIK